MADKESYCQNCEWQGKPESDVCPECKKMGYFMSIPKDFKPAPIAANTRGAQVET